MLLPGAGADAWGVVVCVGRMQRATDEVQRLTESLQLAGGADGDESWMRELNVGDMVEVDIATFPLQAEGELHRHKL